MEIEFVVIVAMHYGGCKEASVWVVLVAVVEVI